MRNLSKFKFNIIFPSLILSVCFLELSFGKLVEFKVVWLFYIYLFYFLFFRLNKVILTLNVKALFPFFIWIAAYLFAFLISNDTYQLVLGELFNILWWTIFTILIALELNTFNKLETFIKYLARIVFIGVLISATLGLLKFYSFESIGIVWKTSYSDDGILIQGSSLNTDYNIYSLGILFGALAGKYLTDNYSTKFNKFLSIGSFPVLLASMLTSGSRRGFLLSLVLIILFVFFNFSYAKPISKIFLEKKFTLLVAAFTFLLIIIGSFLFIENLGTKSEFGSTIFNRLLTTKSQITGVNERDLRWEYSWDLVSNKNFINLIFGSGFDYIKEYSKKFSVFGEDHPHNFIIATYLYGGLFSIFLLFVNLFSSIRILISRGIFNLFFFYLFFLLIFSLTSSNTLFSYRFFLVLLLLPQLIVIRKPAL